MYKKFVRIIPASLCIILIIAISFSVLRNLFPHHHIDTIEKYCKKYGVDTNLVLAIVKAESNFKKDVVSHAGAKGIMQLTDETFQFCAEKAELETNNIFDIDTNLHAGVWYLSYLIERYDRNILNAVAAYNAGMGNVDKWLDNPDCSPDGKKLSDIPFSETKRYTEKINRYIVIYNILYKKR